VYGDGVQSHTAHITDNVFINDDERGLGQRSRNYDGWLEDERTNHALALHEPVSRYRHNRTEQDNADAHMKRNTMCSLLHIMRP
jgi:thiamine phosphate synthase YjbQ (UPF0047 family)